MREMLFRGFTPRENGRDKVFVNGEWIKGQWVQGSYWKLNKTTYCFKEDYERNPDNTEHYIVFDQMTDWGLPNRHLQADVIPETVGQFTGLTDKNGKRIFEGDILETPAWYTNNSYPCVCIFAEEHRVENIQGFGLYHKINDSFELVQSDEWDEFKVIGNIHDNPELLEGVKSDA